MRIDRRTVSSDGFMINLFVVLLDLAAPFTDASYSKLDKVDPDYFRKCNGRIDISDMTKIHATLEEAKEYYKIDSMDTALLPSNFISEVFFLTTAYLHYGLRPAIEYHEAVHRHLRNQREDLREAENNHQYDGTPQEAAYRQQTQRLKKEVDSWHSRTLGSEVQLLDPGFIVKAANFVSFTMTWLVRLVDPKISHPHPQISLENPSHATPVKFGMLPEFLVEDATEFFYFISRHAPQCMLDIQRDQLLVFLIVFLSTPYVNNPYLKGKMVEILFRNTRYWGPRYPRGPMGDDLNFHPLALRSLLPALITVYSRRSLGVYVIQFFG